MSDRIIITSSEEDISKSIELPVPEEDIDEDDQNPVEDVIEDDHFYSDDYEQYDETDEEENEDDEEKEEEKAKEKENKLEELKTVKKPVKQTEIKKAAKRTPSKRNTGSSGSSTVSRSVIHPSMSSTMVRDGGLRGVSRSSSVRSSSLRSSKSSLQGKSSRASNYIRDRVGSANRRVDNQLRNDIGVLRQRVEELSAENRTLRRLAIRQEKELSRFTGTEGELPVILRAHNEETRVLRAKVKQAQDMNKQMLSRLKDKDRQMLKLREKNLNLTRINKERKLDEGATILAELEDTKARLEERDQMYREVVHRQDILERSHKQQILIETKKRQELLKKLKESEKKIGQLERSLKEKDRLINRLNIYSRVQITGMKQSSSTGNISQANPEEIMTKVNKKMKKVNINATEPSFSILREKEYESDAEENEDEKPEDEKIQPNKNNPTPAFKEEVEEEVNEEEIDDETSLDEKEDIPEEETAVKEDKTDTDTTVVENVHNSPQEAHEVQEEIVANGHGEETPQKSFASKKNFFEELGPIKPKEFKKQSKKSEKDSVSSEASNISMTAQEKVNLWLPSTPARKESQDNAASRRGMAAEPVLDSHKKAALLESLNAIDSSKDPSYLPSFAATNGRDRDSALFYSQEADLISSSDSRSSPVTNHASKKNNLMQELFGGESGAPEENRPLKTSFRNSAGTSKTVKFYEDEIESVNYVEMRPKTSPTPLNSFY